MKKLIAVFIIGLGLQTNAQTSQQSLYENARTLMMQGDFSNAIISFNQFLATNPDHTDAKKDLCYTYYLRHDFVNAHKTIVPVTESANADEQSFQLLGMIYKSLEEFKKADKMYQSALKKFPSSGALYNEYGELLWAQEKYQAAIKSWEKGIEMAPNYSGNYYNAAKFYYLSKDKVWAILYGETFLNLESYSKRTDEIKQILYKSYQKLYQTNDIYKDQNLKNSFTKAYLDEMANFVAFVPEGSIPLEELIKIRAKVADNWKKNLNEQYPYRLFQYHDQLIQENLFEAYNQWLFSSTATAEHYDSWKTAHPDAFKKFDDFQRGRVYKIPPGQYYQTPVK